MLFRYVLLCFILLVFMDVNRKAFMALFTEPFFGSKANWFDGAINELG